MRSRLTLGTLLIVASVPSALAQSASSTSLQTKPMQSAPAASHGQSGTPDNSKPKIPPAARSGERGLRFGPDAVDESITVRRIK